MRKDDREYDAIYIGELPPPFGGVTVKNQLLIDNIFDCYNTRIINIYTCLRKPWKIFELIRILDKANKQNIFIYIGSGSLVRYEFLLKLISFIGGNEFLNRVNTFVMGGAFVDFCREHKACLELLKKTGNIYFELQGMIDDANLLGIKNTIYFPNCRDGRLSIASHSLSLNMPVKLVFFSTVNREKGVPELFQMAKVLNDRGINFILDIYGEVSSDYEKEFNSDIINFSNCNYRGVFDVLNNDLYRLLNSYDLLLLPTHWKGESCVGVLIESKIAGIPALVSDWRFNSEIVIDGIEGVVVKNENLAIGFADAVERISKNPYEYTKLCEGARLSIERYDFNVHIPRIKEIVNRQLID